MTILRMADDSADAGPRRHADHRDPVLERLANRDKTEAEVQREGAVRAQRAAERERDWKRRFWIRAGLVVGLHALVVLGIANIYPAGWRDALLMPLLSLGLTTAAVWFGWHWLLTGVVLILAPPVAVLVVGGTVGLWFLKLPVLAGIALLAGYASVWPSGED